MVEYNNRIIVVDDEREIVQAYVDLLSPSASSAPKRSSRGGAPAGGAAAPETTSYEIHKAYSGEEALEIIRREHKAGRRFSGGFFDVKMEGGMDGLQTLQEAWKIDPDLHATIATAYHDRNVNDIDTMFGPRFKDQWDYLNKPFTQAEIVQKARQMVASWNRKQNLQDALQQLKLTQASLIRAERMGAIGQVARGVGHEFGNILQTILGKADLALTDPSFDSAKEKLKLILQAAERASVIVRNLQTFSKTSTTYGPIDVAQAIRNTLSFVNHDLKKNSVVIDDRITSCKQVRANSVEIEQVFLNIIINASHVMPKGGTLELGTRDEGESVVAWVKDTGPGIPEDVLPHIFEYAFTTKGDKGSGLGLAISKEIIENHHGSMSVTTEQGKGTTFTITLPGYKG